VVGLTAITVATDRKRLRSAASEGSRVCFSSGPPGRGSALHDYAV
jgi:hypothetical protein